MPPGAIFGLAVIALCFAIFAYSMAEVTKPSEAGEKRLKVWLGRLFLVAAAALVLVSLALAEAQSLR